jgi:hypothetical protein
MCCLGHWWRACTWEVSRRSSGQGYEAREYGEKKSFRVAVDAPSLTVMYNAKEQVRLANGGARSVSEQRACKRRKWEPELKRHAIPTSVDVCYPSRERVGLFATIGCQLVASMPTTTESRKSHNDRGYGSNERYWHGLRNGRCSISVLTWVIGWAPFLDKQYPT